MVVKAACAGQSGLMMAAVVKLLDRDRGKGSSDLQREGSLVSLSPLSLIPSLPSLSLSLS